MGHLNIFGLNEATLFKFRLHIEPAQLLPTHHKLAPTCLGHVTKFRIFGTALISLDRIQLRSSNLVFTWSLGSSCPWTTN